MKNVTVVAGTSVPAGAKVMLSFDQADARASILRCLEPKKLEVAQAELSAAKSARANALKGLDTDAQSAAEAAVVKAREGLAVQLPYLVLEPAFFKEGESFGIDLTGIGDRGVLNGLGVSPEEQAATLSAIRDEKAEKVAAAAKEAAAKAVSTARGVVTRAQTALDKVKAGKNPAAAKVKTATRSLAIAKDKLKAAEAAAGALEDGGSK